MPAATSLRTHVRDHRHRDAAPPSRPTRTRCSRCSSTGWPASSTGDTTRQASPWWAPPAGRSGGPARPTGPVPSTTWPNAPRARRDGATAGIGHTRWATHGRPSEQNAHPLLDCSGRLALVHNGILENHVELADDLVAAGHHLESDTDTEVLAHLVEDRLAADPGAGLAGALRAALGKVRGAFAVAVVHADEPEVIVAARRVSPLLVGVSEGAAFLASDVPAILGLTREFFVLEDDQVAEIRPGSLAVTHTRRHTGRPGSAHRRLGPRRRPTRRVRRLHEQGDPRAAEGRRRHAARPGASRRDARPRRDPHLDRRAEAGRQGLHRGVREQLPRGVDGQVRDRTLGAPPGRDRHRERVPLPRPGSRRQDPRHRGEPVGGDGRHLPGHPGGRPARREGARDLQRGRLVDGPRVRRGALHEGRSRNRRRRHQDPSRADRRARDPRALPGPGAGDAQPDRRADEARGDGRPARQGCRRGGAGS